MTSITTPSTSYYDLKAQAEELMRQANSIREKEKEKIVSVIKKQIDDFDITPEDLGFRSVRKYTKRASTGKNPPRYRDPQGNEWSGMGRMPTWMHEHIKNGGNREDMLIKNSQ